MTMLSIISAAPLQSMIYLQFTLIKLRTSLAHFWGGQQLSVVEYLILLQYTFVQKKTHIGQTSGIT